MRPSELASLSLMMNLPSSLQTAQLVPEKCPWVRHWRSILYMRARPVQEPCGQGTNSNTQLGNIVNFQRVYEMPPPFRPVYG